MERIGDRTPWPELYIPTPGSRKYYAGSPKESSDISMRDIMIVVDRLFHHLQVSNSVVVTCGTDCLADIAKMVFLMLQRPLHPIIFTGAQKTLDDPENDVERNLRDAFFMADKLDPGVYVVFGGRVLNAFDAYKFSTIDLDAFRSSLHRGELGTVDSTNGSYQIHDDRYMLGKELRNLLKSLGSSNDDQTTFCDYAHDPKVCTVEINTAHDTMAAEILLKNEHIRGLVVKIPGAGGITEEAAQRLSRAAEYTNTKGAKHCKPVVIATRCPDGGTDLELYASSAGVNNCPAIISSGNISASAAVQLLQWGLGGTASVDKLRELFANPAQPITMPCIDRSLLLDGAGVCCEPWDRNPFKAMMVSYGYAAETDSSLRTND
jgi:L-asparaginase